jgi:hypothetical protein
VCSDRYAAVCSKCGQFFAKPATDSRWPPEPTLEEVAEEIERRINQ